MTSACVAHRILKLIEVVKSPLRYVLRNAQRRSRSSKALPIESNVVSSGERIRECLRRWRKEEVGTRLRCAKLIQQMRRKDMCPGSLSHLGRSAHLDIEAGKARGIQLQIRREARAIMQVAHRESVPRRRNKVDSVD